jgi:uncharacterized membrane protein
MQANSFLGALDHERIVKAIQAAEARSRGEVRVHVARQAVQDAQPNTTPVAAVQPNTTPVAAVQPNTSPVAAVETAAARQFETLGMTQTAERNGVLLFVAPVSQTFAVIGDEGIHARCGPDFWKDVAAAMETDFRAGRYTDGIVKGVARVGEALATHFPRQEGTADANELPDEVTED